MENLRRIDIHQSYIPRGVAIPQAAALNGVETVSLTEIHGSGAADALAGLRLPALRELTVAGEAPSHAALPFFPALEALYIDTPDALDIIANNSHLPGILQFGAWRGGGTRFTPDLENPRALEAFTRLEVFVPPGEMRDFSPLAKMAALRVVDFGQNRHIDSLMPLAGLPALQTIRVRQAAYEALPQRERLLFSPENNRCPGAVHVLIDYPASPRGNSPSPWVGDLGALHDFWWNRWNFTHEPGEFLELADMAFECFDFLLEYPRLKWLIIRGSHIAEGLALPRLESLLYLHVEHPRALEIIQNNAHIPGYLAVGTGDFEAALPCLAGLGAFTALHSLSVLSPVGDISALAGAVNLYRLSLMRADNLASLDPVKNLPRLQSLILNTGAFFGLPAHELSYWASRPRHRTVVEARVGLMLDWVTGESFPAM